MDFCIPEVKGQLDCDKTLRHKSSFLAIGPYNDFVSIVIFFSSQQHSYFRRRRPHEDF